MSIVVLNEVLDSSRATGTARLLLVVLAEQAHEDGLTWPGVARLAKRVRTSERNVQYLLRDLEEMGELIVDRSAGRGNTNEYRVLPPATSARLIEELTARLEKVKSSAEKVKTGALLEKVKSSAEKVNPSAQKVKSSAEKVKRAAPEPSGTVKNQEEPTAVSQIDVEFLEPEVTPGLTAEGDEQEVLEGLIQPHSGADRAETADAARQAPEPSLTEPPAPQDVGTIPAQAPEDLPGAAADGGARAALGQALSPWDLSSLLDERPTRQGWLSLDTAQIWALAAQARQSNGRRFRGELVALFDETALAQERPPIKPAETDMQALFASSSLHGTRAPRRDR